MQVEPQVSKTALLTWLVNNYNVEQNEKVPALVLYNAILTYPSMTRFGFWQPAADGRTITCSNCGCLVAKEGIAAISSEMKFCPQCGRVWAPCITKCSPCEVVATGGHGIKHDWSPAEDDDDDDYCTCYNDGECWGTKEREETNCGGKASKCDKYNSEWR